MASAQNAAPALADTRNGRGNGHRQATTDTDNGSASPLQEIPIAVWPKNSSEEIRVDIGSFSGRATIAIRAWYTDSSGTSRPGKAGPTIALRHLPEIAAAFTLALETARERGLLDKSDGGEE